MSDKTNIAYIGPKPTKRDTITGSRLLFKRGQSVPVDNAIANRLLEYPKVWTTAENAKKLMAESDKKLKEEAKKAEEAAKKAAEEALLNSLETLGSDGEVVDLAKMNGGQVETLVEALELEIDVNPKPVAEYKLAVRDVMREKFGTPSLKDE